jgi:hypothetical protein
MPQHKQKVKKDPIPKSAAEFFRRFPLPPAMRPYEEAIKSLTTEQLSSVILGGKFKGYSDKKIVHGVIQAAEFYGQHTQRCMYCLGWTDNDFTFVLLHEGGYLFSAACGECRRKIDNDQETQAMLDNAKAYLAEGERR